MLTKALLTVLAASAVGHEELVQDTPTTECTSVLQKMSFGAEREALAAKRVALANERDSFAKIVDETMPLVTDPSGMGHAIQEGAIAQLNATRLDAMNAKINAVDSALSHEHVIDELEALKSKVSTNGFKIFPAGDAITSVAEEAIDEEIKHQKAHEALALKLEDVEVKPLEVDAENFVIDAITHEFDLAEESAEFDLAEEAGAADAIQLIGDEATAEDEAVSGNESSFAAFAGAFFSKIKTANSLESHEHVIKELEGMQKKVHEGGFEQLPAGDAVTVVAEEALNEEIHHQKAHKALVQKLDEIPVAMSQQDSLARNFVLDAISNEVVPGADQPYMADLASGGDEADVATSDEDDSAEDDSAKDDGAETIVDAADSVQSAEHVTARDGFTVESVTNGTVVTARDGFTVESVTNGTVGIV